MVVASYDRTFEYRKLQIAFDAIWLHRRARLIATNPDRFCPMPGGRGEPDCAAITAASMHRRACQANLGKPNPRCCAALEGIDAAMTECIMVGDRLGTDIRMGLDAGDGDRAGPHRRDDRRRRPRPGAGRPAADRARPDRLLDG